MTNGEKNLNKYQYDFESYTRTTSSEEYRYKKIDKTTTTVIIFNRDICNSPRFTVIFYQYQNGEKHYKTGLNIFELEAAMSRLKELDAEVHE